MNPPKDLKPRHPCWGFLFSEYFCIFTLMKKYILFLIAIATFAMVSCGSGSTTTETTDSAAVEVDTTSSVVDSTNVEAPAGGGSATEQPIK